MTRVRLTLAACLLAVGFAPVLAAELSKDWPQWRGPGRDNKSPLTGLRTDWETNPPQLGWKITGLGRGFASVAIVGDRLYTTGNKDGSQQLIAVDLANKQIVWSTPITSSIPKHDYEGSRCTPTIDGDRIYTTHSGGGIACVSTKGEKLWSHEFAKTWPGSRMQSGWGYSESPLVDGDLVVCTPGSPDAMIVALDKKTGKEVWKSAVKDEGSAGGPGAGYASIVISNAAGVKQYVQLIGRGLIGVRASDGKLLWRYNRIATGVACIPTPVTTGDYVFTSTGYGDGGTALLKLEKAGDGIEAKEVYYLPGRELQNHHGGLVLVGDYLYFGNGHNNGFPTCVELQTGKIVWGGKLRGAGSGSAAITWADNHVIFRYQSGEVALVEAVTDGYHLKGSFKPEVIDGPCWAQPVALRGQLFLREQDSLMAYDIAAK